MRKYILAVFIFVFFIVCRMDVYAAAGDEVYDNRGNVIGIYDENGRIIYQPYAGDADENSNATTNALNILCSTDDEKTIVIPSGTVLKLQYLIRIGDNTSIIAEGATIIQREMKRGIISHNVDADNYGALKNISITGGKWISESNTGQYTMIRFAHAKDIKLSNMEIVTNYESHGIEIIACKNVTIKNCKLYAEGKKRKDSVEEALQIDVATKTTAPGVWNETGNEKLVKGQTCSNITIKDCEISGGRGVCANYASKENKYLGKFHDKITIENCKITGETAEGVALFNTLNSTVKNNVITSNSTRTKEAYSVGLNIIMMGKAPSAVRKAKVTVSGNTIKGGRQAFNVVSKKGSQYGGTFTVKNNKLYCSTGKDNAIHIEKQAVAKPKLKESGNKIYKWKK